MVKSETLTAIKYVASQILGIVSYEALMEVGLVCFGFFILSWVNLSIGTPTIDYSPMIVSILDWLGFSESGSYGTKDIRRMVSSIFSILSLVGILIYFLNEKVLKIKLKITKWWGLGVIVVFFVFGLVSCFSPSAKNGAESIVLILVLFLVYAVFNYGRYLVFQLLKKYVSSII